MKNLHAAYTRDEKFWMHFDGEVPRQCDIISYGESEYKVIAVRWFLVKLKDQSTVSSARVLVEEI